MECLKSGKAPTQDVIASQQMQRPNLLSLIPCLGALLLGGSILAQTTGASPTEEVRKEIQKVREEYEQRIHALEQRLNELEAAQKAAVAAPPAAPTAPSAPVPATTPAPSAPSSPAGTPPASEAGAGATPSARLDAGSLSGQFREGTESIHRSLNFDRDQAIAKRVQQIMYDFLDIAGYVRAGYGRNDRGGVQVPFQAPGAPSKYRLGNETEVYGELAFGKNFYLADTFSRDPSPSATESESLRGPIARIQFRPSYSLSYAGESSWGLPEAWGAIGNLFGAQPDLKFWAGNRLYRRYDVHMIDWFFYNMSGLGGGVEDVNLGFGKAALAWIGNSSGSAAYTDEILDPPENRSGFAKSNLDLRLYDVPLPLGKGEFGVVYARTEGGLGLANNGEPFAVPDADGFSFHFLHLAEKFLDDRSVNKFSVQGGWGGAKNLSSGFEIFNLGGVNYITPELPDAWRVRLSEDFILQPSDLFSVGAVLAFQYTDYDQLAVPGLGGMADGIYGGKRFWYSAGARPILHFTRNVSLAFEGGVDYTDTQGVVDSVANLHGTLWKVTLAPQVSLGRHFMSRPAIRAYITYAGWLDGFEGYVGGPTYADRDYGYAAGIQMEAWW